MTNKNANCINSINHANHISHIRTSQEINPACCLPLSISHHLISLPHSDLRDKELALEALIEGLRQPFLNENKKRELTKEALGKLRELCKEQETSEAERAERIDIQTKNQVLDQKLDKTFAHVPDHAANQTQNHAPNQKLAQTPARKFDQAPDHPSDPANSHSRSNRSGFLRRGILYTLVLMVGTIKVMTAQYAFAAAAATLNFDQGITDGVNPIIKLVLDHNGKAIFLSSAIGMLLGGGGNNDGWARLKMGGLWAIGAAALVQIIKGTLGIDDL